MRKFLILAIVLFLCLTTSKFLNKTMSFVQVASDLGIATTSSLEDKLKTQEAEFQLSGSSLATKVEVRAESNDTRNNNTRPLSTLPTPITAKGAKMETEIQDSSNISSLRTEDHRRRTKRAVDKLLRNYRTGKLRAVGDSVSYHCYKTIHKDESGRNRVKRGCIKVPVELSACDMLQETTSNMQKCKICTTAKCNSSSAVGVSFIVIASVVVYNGLNHLRVLAV